MVEHTPVLRWLGTTGCAPPCVPLLCPKGTCPDQALNSAEQSCGRNTGCIFSPCWGIPAHLSWDQVAQPLVQLMAKPVAQACSACRASLVPSPQARDVPQRRKGSHSMCPLAVAVMCHLVPWCKLCSAPGSPPSAACSCSSAASSALGSLAVLGFPGTRITGVLPAGTTAVGRAGPGLLSSRTLSLRAQRQGYLSRMRKSITMRTMGRKMKSRLSISAASRSASNRR